ncbi:MAG: hypothetical protein WAO35_05180 [Terriglobia bacterium]
MRKGLIVGGALLLAVLAGVIAAKRMAQRLPGYLRDRTVSTLREHFSSDIEFSDLQVSLFPKIVIRAQKLVLRLHGRTDVPPLISSRQVSAEIEFWELFRTTRHVRRITLEGLRVTMPPVEPRAPKTSHPPPGKKAPGPSRVVVDEIVADGAELNILVHDPNKPPHTFYFRSLRLRHAGLGKAMTYQATLTNPLPAGEIATHGQFGPWQRDQPRLTPLAGAYTFTQADLSTIRGLSGTLSSRGQFNGLLDRIDVRGETSTPDFSLGLNGHSVPLDTRFHAIVDGTTGNTLLDSVQAKLGHSQFAAHGGVFRVPGNRYRRVLLDAVSSDARLEDLLRLALAADKPPMTGDVAFRTRIDVPPGSGDFADRLKLDGEFHIRSAQFSQLDIQNKVASLSRRGSGQTAAPSFGSVASDFAGKFVLEDGGMTFSRLTFEAPGASVNLHGTYTLHDQDVDFQGALRLQAKLSQLTRGLKSIPLKPLDPLFEKKGAGTYLPIRITGTGSDPHFKLDIKRVF